MGINLEQSGGGGGGGGTPLTGTGLARNTSVCTELSGDATTSGSNAVSVVKINGLAVPVSAGYLGSNSSGQLVDNSSLALNAQTGTSYAIQGSDKGKVVSFANATSSTIAAATLAQAGTGSFTSGWFCYLVNKGSNSVSVTPTTSTIGGCAVMLMPPGSSCFIYSDGTNYQVIADGITQTGAGQGFFSNGIDLGIACAGGGGINTSILWSSSANVMRVNIFALPRAAAITKVTTFINVASASGNALAGIYDSNGNLILSAKFSTTTGSVGLTTALTTTYLLLSGTYFYAFGADNTTATGNAFSSTGMTTALMNKNFTRSGTAANSISGAAMPATLGTISAAAVNCAVALFES